MSDVDSITVGEYVIQARAIPAGHMWAAEYSVSKGGLTKIKWRKTKILEGMPTHGTAIHAAFDAARVDIDNQSFDSPGQRPAHE
jgi:hypothetical protein